MHNLNKIIFIFFLLIPFDSRSEGKDIKNEFLSANQAYQNNDYEEALKLYSSILNQGYINADIYYNLGNTHYKLNQIPKSILFYEKALKLNPNDEDIKYNLKLTNTKIYDKNTALPEFFITTIWRNIFKYKGANFWAISSIVFSFICCGLFILYFLATSSLIKKTGFYIALLSLFFSIFTSILSNSHKNHIEKSSYAIVFKSSLTVISSPNTSGTKLFVVHEGTKVKIIEELEDWSKISLLDGNIGWVKSKEIESI